MSEPGAEMGRLWSSWVLGAALCIGLGFGLGDPTRLSHWQMKNMKNKDQRMKIMNEILSGIKVSTMDPTPECLAASPPPGH